MSLSPAATRMEYRLLETDRLDFPDPLLRSLYPAPDANIQDQVQEFGLLQPLPVLEQPHGIFHLLAGFNFLPVLRQLQVREVAGAIWPSDTPVLHLYALQILHGLSTLHTSPILQAHLLNRAQQHLDDESLRRLLSLMGHKPQRSKLQELTALLHLHPKVVLALHQGALSPRTAKLLARLSPADQQTLVELINRLHPGGSKQQKLVEMLCELRLRLQLPMDELIPPWWDEHTEDADNLPQQLNTLLRQLHERCAPHSTQAEKAFQRLLQHLNPPSHIRIDHSPSFEDESMEVTIRFADQAELQHHWPILLDLIAKP